jgi:hypothetical protein
VSVECALFLVDWAEFVAAAAGCAEIYPAAARWQAEPLPWDSLSAQSSFLACLDALPPGGLANRDQAAHEVFDHLFWSWRGPQYRVMDLAAEPEPFGLETAWGPETTRRFAGIARGIDLGEARPWFRPDPSEWFPPMAS